MGSLISVHNLEKWQGARLLFEKISFGLDENSHTALIGPNGAGKSTLMKILAEKIEADKGEISRSKNCRISLLEQSHQFLGTHSILETVLPDKKTQALQDDFYYEQLAYELLYRMGFDDAKIDLNSPASNLSGGWKKKVALARELLLEPNLLLLDEPTNHLDIESILWMEDFLKQASFATLIITHDRSFLQNTCDRIYEINSCYSTGFLDVKGSYSDYCEIKAKIIEVQAQSERSASNRLRREMEWMKKSPKARTTKQKGRIKEAEKLEENVSKMRLRKQEASVKLEFKSPESAPKILIEGKNLSLNFSENKVFENLDLLVERKSRIGLIGANGSGKSSLIKTLLGQHKSSSGKLRQSELLQVSYLDQNKDFEDPEVKLINFFSSDGGHVNFCGKWIDVRSYLSRFGFHADQHVTSINKLSGGERARLVFAKLMLQESNLLILDEPTNDLDIQTLNILEEELELYPGALILVSHDRYFLDRVCSEIYAFSPDKRVKDLTRFSDIHQWEAWHDQELARSKKPLKAKKAPEEEKAAPPSEKSPPKKLSYTERIEFEKMEEVIAQQEEKVANLTKKLQNSDSQKKLELHALTQEIAQEQSKLDSLYERWEELGSRS